MDNKIILILGASSDIGLSLIEEIYNDYDTIIAHYHSSIEQLESLKKKLGDKLQIEKADFTDEKDTDRFIELIEKKYKTPTDIVHLPAQKIENIRFTKSNWTLFQNDLNIQLRSIYKITLKFIGSMAKNKKGKFVFILSSVTVNAPKFMVAYTTAKYALLGFMKSLSAEYADKFITINALSPSMIETKFLDNVAHLVVEHNALNNPMKRNAVLSDIVPMIEFLLSDNANYITGQNIIISGGGVI